MMILFQLRRYGFWGAMRAFFDILFTKLTLPQAKIIRRPFYIRNIGSIIGCKGMSAGPNLIMDVLSKDATLIIGDNLAVNHSVHIGAMSKVVIGNNVLMASRVYISDHSHGSYRMDGELNAPYIPPNERPLYSEEIKIGDNCWLGEGVCILPGVTIGAGSIIGALSVVNRDIPANSIAVGAPAKVIKQWDQETLCWKSVNES